MPLKFFGRISAGSYALLETFCSLFEGSFVSDIIKISTCVLLVSSASSARLPFMLLALRVPIRRLFRDVLDVLELLVVDSLCAELNALVCGDLSPVLALLSCGLLKWAGVKVSVGDATSWRNTESSPGIVASGDADFVRSVDERFDVYGSIRLYCSTVTSHCQLKLGSNILYILSLKQT